MRLTMASGASSDAWATPRAQTPSRAVRWWANSRLFMAQPFGPHRPLVSTTGQTPAPGQGSLLVFLIFLASQGTDLTFPALQVGVAGEAVFVQRGLIEQRAGAQQVGTCLHHTQRVQ